MRLFPALLALSLIGATAAFAAQPTEERDIAQLRVLDKVTARVEALEVPVDQTLKFGTLLITVRACRVTPAEETPEAASFIEVSEMKPNEPETPRFKGWMFASSPALSALEHPIYDLWVTGCKASKPAPQPQPTTPQPPAPTKK